MMHRHIDVALTSFCREDGAETHGTDDVDGFGDDYTPAARELLDTWVNHRDDLADGALQPFQNAESIAAAATGKYCFVASLIVRCTS